MQTINTNNAPKAIGPYSQAKVVNNILYTSGQIPLHPETGLVVGDDITTQTEQVIKNLGAILEAAGTDYTSVIKTTCYLADMNDFAAYNSVYEKYFTEKPARSCVAVKTLPKNVLVEIEAIAELK
jgi:2-iminobutanoate/2-iminopropanoate deaminase